MSDVTFEYQVLSQRIEYAESYPATVEDLEQLGLQGWELVSVVIVPSRKEAGVVFERCYLKRETKTA